jgi:FlaA1/EpsC-like NDP-sugar epimerase
MVLNVLWSIILEGKTEPRYDFNGKVVLITGVCGTIGSELLKGLLSNPEERPDRIIGLDINESQLFFLEKEYIEFKNVFFYLSDVRDLSELNGRFNGVDVVFHCAALKHVVLCERCPNEALKTNVIGVQNIISAALGNKVSRVIFTSSDKAVNPTSVMGTTKLMGERLITAANSDWRSNGTIFSSTRFGNVMGSSGSVIPIFREQIRLGGPITLTSAKMTRFIMSVKQASALVLESARFARGGEVFVTKMPVLRIIDLAQAMIDELCPVFGRDPDTMEITEIGIKPGEKMYEELMSDEETRRTVELATYFSVLPAYSGIYDNQRYQYDSQRQEKIVYPYVSESLKPLTVDEIRLMLQRENLVSSGHGTPATRYWPGDK